MKMKCCSAAPVLYGSAFVSIHRGRTPMLTPEDAAVIGLAAPEQPRSSGISQLLRKISNDLKTGWWDMTEENTPPHRFQIRVASDRDSRERAYRLAHRVYRERGYCDGETQFLATPYDADPGTFTLLAQDQFNRDAATMTLIFDSGAGLPCDEIYGSEINLLRQSNRRLVEVTRLVIADEFQHSKLLLIRMINFIYIFSRRIKGFDDFVIEVHPRHAAYYTRMLYFERFGPERPCPRVRNMPAVLLRVDLSVMDREVRRVGGRGFAAAERTLYPHFYSWIEEGAAASFLSQNHTPMSDGEKLYFGLSGARPTLAESTPQ
jgi:hypothetical protein